MKQLQPVLWTKGTFLTPQHLQLQDRFLEDSLNFRLQALKFCAWGFSEVVLDQELLADGHLAVSRASGIFPDGLLFDIPGSDQPPPPRLWRSSSIRAFAISTSTLLCPTTARRD